MEWKTLMDDTFENRIDLTPDSRPFRLALYRAGPKLREIEELKVQKQFKADVIEPDASECASPVSFVPKKDRFFRFWIDHHHLIKVTVRNTYSLPHIDECIDSSGIEKILSTLSANSDSWKIPVKKRTETNGFCRPCWIIIMQRHAIGLNNASTPFQRALDAISFGFKCKTRLIHLDSVIAFSRLAKKHLRHIAEIVSISRSAHVSLKLLNCKLFLHRGNIPSPRH